MCCEEKKLQKRTQRRGEKTLAEKQKEPPVECCLRCSDSHACEIRAGLEARVNETTTIRRKALTHLIV